MTLHCTMAEWLQHGPDLCRVIDSVMVGEAGMAMICCADPWLERVPGCIKEHFSLKDAQEFPASVAERLHLLSVACLSWARAEACRRHEKA